MSETGIHGFDVTYADDDSTRPVRSVAIAFGNGHRVEIAVEDGKARVRMVSHGVGVLLDASRHGCCFERAVNLLRLHLPETRL